MAKKQFQVTTSAQMSRIFFVSFAVNIVVLMFANKLAPGAVVFGTEFISPVWGLFHSMAALSLINMLCVPIFEFIQEEKQRELLPKEWMMGYFFVNFVGLWLVSRFAEQFGFGISAWWVAAIVALGLDFLQGPAIMLFAYGSKEK